MALPLSDGDGGTRHLQPVRIKRRRHQGSGPDIHQMPCAHITSIAASFNQDLALPCVESLGLDQRIIPTATCPNRKKYDFATRQMLRKTMSPFSLVAIGCGQELGSPPESETCSRPLFPPPLAKMICPSLPQLPPRPFVAGASTVEPPPAMETFLSWPPAKKPIR